MLLKDTHSDDRLKIFTKSIYDDIKSGENGERGEKTFKAFIYSEIDQAFFDNVKKTKLKNAPPPRWMIDEILHSVPFFDTNNEKIEA